MVVNQTVVDLASEKEVSKNKRQILAFANIIDGISRYRDARGALLLLEQGA